MAVHPPFFCSLNILIIRVKCYYWGGIC